MEMGRKAILKLIGKGIFIDYEWENTWDGRIENQTDGMLMFWFCLYLKE